MLATEEAKLRFVRKFYPEVNQSPGGLQKLRGDSRSTIESTDIRKHNESTENSSDPVDSKLEGTATPQKSVLLSKRKQYFNTYFEGEL